MDNNKSKYTQHGSTIYMELGTALGMFMGIIAFLIYLFAHKGSVALSMMIMAIGGIVLRIVGYFIDQFVDKHATPMSRTERRQKEREARSAAAAKKTGAKYVGGKQKDKKEKKKKK